VCFVVHNKKNSKKTLLLAGKYVGPKNQKSEGGEKTRGFSERPAKGEKP